MKKFIFIILFFIAHYLLFINNCLSQWQPDVRLTYDPAVSQTSLNYAWCIAASGDTVHVNWFDERNGLTQVYYKRSTDKGITWGPDTRLSTSSYWAERGGIAVNGPVVHIVWQDWRNPSWEIYYIRSTDGGNTWGSEIRLTNAAGNSWGPTVSASGLFVHVVWTDTRDGNTEVYYKRSTDGGISWGADTRLTNNPADSWYPVFKESGSIVHVIWTDTRNGTNQVYYKRSTDDGLNWGNDTRVTNTTFNAYNPTIVVNGSLVHIAWRDNRDGNDEIYYNRSTNAGLSWGADTRLTNAPDMSSSPSLACSGSNLHLTWEDLRDGNSEIYYKQSTNGGLDWTIDKRLTNSTGYSGYTSVCVSAQCVHVVWFDERDGNREIYYKRNPKGNLTVNLKLYLDGFWNGVGQMPDTVRVYLANSTAPYSFSDSAIIVLSTLGSSNFAFTNSMTSGSYYIVVKHRNHIETWSSTPQTISDGILNYDFTTAATQAYGNNMKLIGTKWCLFTGDVNQDGVVDFTDLALVDNDNNNFVTGYVKTDLNGDGAVDFIDLAICDNYNTNFVAAIKPPGAMTVKIPRTYEQMKAVEKYMSNRIENANKVKKAVKK